MHRWLSLVRVLWKTNELTSSNFHWHSLWKLQVLCRYWKSPHSTSKLQCYNVRWLRSIAGSRSVLLWASLGSRARHCKAGFAFLVRVTLQCITAGWVMCCAWAEHLTRSAGIMKMLYAGTMACIDIKCTYVGLARIKVICWRVQITSN